jgi:hypothetical protein
MKYFTPELIARGQSDDCRILTEVEARWDELCDEYSAYLDTIKAEFPPGIRHIEDSYYLHDATILGIGRHDGALVMMLRLDPPPQSLLTFTYDLVEKPRIVPEALPECVRTKGTIIEWQYDEIEKVNGQPPTWHQSIRLSNGWEITLQYRDVKVKEMEALLPASRYRTVARTPTVVPESA